MFTGWLSPILVQMTNSPCLSSDVLLSLTESSLKKVVADLRAQLRAALEERRARKSYRPSTTMARNPCRGSPARVPKRPGTEGPPRIRATTGINLDPTRDLFVSSRTALSNATCNHGLVRPRSSLEGLGCRGIQSVAERLHLKVSHAIHQGTTNGKKRTKPGLSTEEMRSQVSELRAKIHEVKVLEERMIRDLDYNPKQVLTEFSKFGVKVRNGRRHDRKTTTDSTKQLSALIDSIDAQLSTNEALAAFKQMGIEYHPRTAAGRKNAMATGLSAALAPNGLKLLASQEDAQEDDED